MTHEDMLQLAEDAKNWRDAADWKDNCGRLSQLLNQVPDLITELKQLRAMRAWAAEEDAEDAIQHLREHFPAEYHSFIDSIRKED